MMHGKTMTAWADAGIYQSEKECGPDVVSIRFNLGYDSTDHPAVFFRILLSDSAAKHRLRDVVQRVQSSLSGYIDWDELGFGAYFNYRSVSEQAKLKEPEWEPTAHPEAPPRVASTTQPPKDSL